MTRHHIRLAVLAAGLLLLASCSSDGDETADITIAPTTTTTEATTSTSETTTTTTEETTVADDPRVEAEALIRANAQLDRENWVACTTDPADCDPETLFAETSTGRYYTRGVQAVQNWQEEEQVWRHPDDIEDNDFLRVEEVIIADDLLTATVTVCERDGRAGWIPGPDGEDVMLDETYGDEFTLAENFYVFEGGSWTIDDTNVIAQSIVPGEEPACDPE